MIPHWITVTFMVLVLLFLIPTVIFVTTMLLRDLKEDVRKDNEFSEELVKDLRAYAGPYVDGSYSPDPDLTPSWSGAVNNSPSVLSGEIPPERVISCFCGSCEVCEHLDETDQRFANESELPRDAINPDHYRLGNIEVWDFIVDQKLNYLRGSATKYICRAGYKEEGSKEKALEDIEKAINFMRREHRRVLEEEN